MIKILQSTIFEMPDGTQNEVQLVEHSANNKPIQFNVRSWTGPGEDPTYKTEDFETEIDAWKKYRSVRDEMASAFTLENKCSSVPSLTAFPFYLSKGPKCPRCDGKSYVYRDASWDTLPTSENTLWKASCLDCHKEFKFEVPFRALDRWKCLDVSLTEHIKKSHFKHGERFEYEHQINYLENGMERLQNQLVELQMKMDTQELENDERLNTEIRRVDEKNARIQDLNMRIDYWKRKFQDKKVECEHYQREKDAWKERNQEKVDAMKKLLGEV